MIGNGVAALASTTTLASNGKGGPASGRGGDDFAQTLDQAMNRDMRAKDGTGAETRQMPEGPVHHRHVIAEAGWRGTAGSSLADAAETTPEGDTAESGAEALKGKSAAEEDTLLPANRQVDRVAAAVDGKSVGERPEVVKTAQGENADSDSPDETETKADTAGETADGETPKPRIPAEAPDSTDGTIRSQPEDRVPADESAPEERPAPSRQPADPAANVSAAKAGPDGLAAEYAVRAADASTAGRQAADAARATERRQAADPKSDRGEADTVRATGSVDKSPGPAAASRRVATPETSQRVMQDGVSRTGNPEASPNGAQVREVSASVSAEPRSARDTAPAPEPAARTAVRARSDAPVASASADKPGLPVSGTQSAQIVATGGSSTPAGQVAEAVARDLDELAPSRIELSTAGTLNRPVKSLRLQLNPAELGSINIRLQSVEGELRVSIRADSDETARMLSRDSEVIRSALRAAGISGPEITVSVNRNDTATQQFAGQNRDASGQQTAAQDNRGDMSNESGHSNREGSSGNPRGAFSGGDVDAGNSNRDNRVFI